MSTISSDVWPCSGSIAAVSSDALLSGFLDVLERHVAPFLDRSRMKSELTISLVEHGDIQGSAGLHFDSTVLQRVEHLNASLRIRLRSAPIPKVEADGKCSHCDAQLLASVTAGPTA